MGDQEFLLVGFNLGLTACQAFQEGQMVQAVREKGVLGGEILRKILTSVQTLSSRFTCESLFIPGRVLGFSLWERGSRMEKICIKNLGFILC